MIATHIRMVCALYKGDTMQTMNEMRQKLETMPIGPQDAALDFTARLARENGWSRQFTEKVVTEYRRFLVLAATSENGIQVTPSDAVDQAWHLHLTYTRDYWDVMCGQILGFALHHGPTAGGKIEKARYHEQYEATLSRYHDVFGHAAPDDIWPQSHIRFAGQWRRIDTQRNVIISRPKVLAASIVPATGLLAACAVNDGIYGGIAFAMILLSPFVTFFGGRLLTYWDRKKKDSGSGCGASVGDSDSGCGGGGCGGCGG
jgi:hypothetical protein